MFAQAVGMTASDWPVSRVVKRSQTIDPNLALLSFTEFAVSRLILRLKAMEFCSDAVSLGREDRSKHVGSNALDGSENDAIYDD